MHLRFQQPPHYFPPLAFALFIADLAAIIGLWCYFSWARWVFLFALVSSVVLTVSVPHSPYMTAASWLEMRVSCTLDGVIIVMMFLPPIGDLFGSRRSNQAM